MTATDTIVAIASPPGRGAVGIVRVSGPDVPRIAAAVLGELPAPRRAVLAAFRDAAAQSLDRRSRALFPGAAFVHRRGRARTSGPRRRGRSRCAACARLLELGCRGAAPGEFSQRAYLNDKIDLAQAEAVADLIDAGSRRRRARRGALAARRVLGAHPRAPVRTDRAARPRRGRDRFPRRRDRVHRGSRDRQAARASARDLRFPASGRAARHAPGRRPDGRDRGQAERRQVEPAQSSGR